MIVFSLLLILVAVTLLVLGFTAGSSSLLIASIVASLLAAITLVISARRSAAARRAASSLDDNPPAVDQSYADIDASSADTVDVDLDLDAAPGRTEPPTSRRASRRRGAEEQASAGVPGGADRGGPGDAERTSADEPERASEGAEYVGRGGADRVGPGEAGRTSAGESERASGGADYAGAGGSDHAEAKAFAAGGRDAEGAGYGAGGLGGEDAVRGGDDRGVEGGAAYAAGGRDIDDARGPDAEVSAPVGAPMAASTSDGRDRSSGVSDFPGLSEEFGEPDPDDPDDEPLPQAVRPTDAVRVAAMDSEVLVVDGRPRYHLADCAHLLGKLTEPLPVSEAVELGFNPCGLCRPVDRLIAAASRR